MLEAEEQLLMYEASAKEVKKKKKTQQNLEKKKLMKPFFGLSPGRTSFKAQAPVIKLKSQSNHNWQKKLHEN